METAADFGGMQVLGLTGGNQACPDTNRLSMHANTIMVCMSVKLFSAVKVNALKTLSEHVPHNVTLMLHTNRD